MEGINLDKMKSLLNIIIPWIFGGLFLFLSLILIVNRVFFDGLLFLLAGIISLPVTAKQLENIINVRISGNVRFFIVLLLMAVVFSTIYTLAGMPLSSKQGTSPPTGIDNYLRDYGSKGQVIFPESEKMKVGEPTTVTAYITKNISEVIHNANEKFITKNIIVTNQMEVTLTDEDKAFEITPNKDKRQYVGEEVTDWEWSVTPLKSGKHTLKLNVLVVIENTATSYGDTTSTYNELEQSIDVDANYIYSIKSNWQWIIGTLIALMSALGIKGTLYKKKLEEESQK